MMKRLIPLLLAALLLCGCAADPQPTESLLDETQIPETQYVAPTEPAGSYMPGSEAEVQTGGALRAYPMEAADCYAIATIGSDVLLFSGADSTVLTRLAGDNLYTIARCELDVMVYPEDASFRISENGITYYDYNDRSVVFLDNDLHEVSRISAPEAMIGTPILSSNRLKLYYCTDQAIRVLDLETGLDRLLKEISYPQQGLEGILMNDTVLYCSVSDGDENNALFIFTETGELLYQRENDMELTSYGGNYYTQFAEGTLQANLFGSYEEDPEMLIPADPFAPIWYLENVNGAVTASGAYGSLSLDYYDLGSGMRTADLELAEVNTPWCMEADAEKGCVYFLADEIAGDGEVIYRWDIAESPSGDETVYTGPRYTLDNPDTEGLAACSQQAEELSARYGVEVLVGMEAVAVEPWDYEMYPEYQVPVIEKELENLATVMETFPDGFFDTLADGTSDGPVKICLVRSLTGSPESGSLAEASGIQFWSDGQAYVAIAAGYTFAQSFYHEMFHVIESRVFSECTAYYDWEDLNPDGFQYDNDYLTNQERVEDTYLQGETRAFIDTYSMSYPKEDRARIMEYASMTGNEEFFESETMQAKLETLCKGIREAFDLREYPNELIWEQYLNEPLIP